MNSFLSHFTSVPIESLTVVCSYQLCYVAWSVCRMAEVPSWKQNFFSKFSGTTGTSLVGLPDRAQALSLRGGAESSLCHRGMHISQVFHAFGAAMETCVRATVHRAGVVSIALWTLLFRLFDFDLCAKSCQV